MCKDGSTYQAELGCAYMDFAEPKLDCPHPYKLDKHSGQCVTVTYGESSIICPAGSYQHGKKCISELTAPVEINCKHHDTILTEQGCLRRKEPVYEKDEAVPPKLSCPKHFKFEDGVCVSNNKADGELVCEEGWQLHGKKCYNVDLVPPVCDKGYTYNGSDCGMESVVPPEPVCPKHSEEIKGQCFQTVTSHPQKVCEKGYDLDKHGKKCVARILVQAILYDSKKGGNDIKVDCKHGEVDPKTGDCFQFHYSHPVDVCDAGFEPHKKKCISQVPVEPDFVCPKHTTMDKSGQCSSSKKTKVKCPKHYKFDDKTGQCATTLKDKAAQICPKDSSSLKGKHCTSLEFAEPLASCKHGYELAGDVCVKPGGVKAGKDKLYKPKVDCPHGFKLDKHQQLCIQHLHAEVEPVCEKGYVAEKKKCVAYHTAAPQAMCPKGFVNDGGKGCSRVSYVRPVFECPKGATEHGHKCWVYQEQDIVLGAMPAKGKGFEVPVQNDKKI